MGEGQRAFGFGQPGPETCLSLESLSRRTLFSTLVELFYRPFSEPASPSVKLGLPKFRSDGIDFHLKSSVSKSHGAAVAGTGTCCRDRKCELRFETCMDNPKKMQAKSPAVSPGAFLSYHSQKMKAICVGQKGVPFPERQTAQPRRGVKSNFVKEFENWISEK